jgi:hypothetical protein
MDACTHYPPPAGAKWVNRIGFLPGQSTLHQIPQQDRYGTQVKHRFSQPLRTGVLILKRLSCYSTPPAKISNKIVFQTHDFACVATCDAQTPCLGYSSYKPSGLLEYTAPHHWMNMSDVSGQRYGTIFKSPISNKN